MDESIIEVIFNDRTLASDETHIEIGCERNSHRQLFVTDLTGGQYGKDTRA